MEWVDKLDGGSVTKEEFLSQHPVVWLGRIIGGNDVISLEILEALSRGNSVEEILSSENISSVIAEKRDYLTRANSIIAERLEVIDRLAVVRLEDMGCVLMVIVLPPWLERTAMLAWLFMEMLVLGSERKSPILSQPHFTPTHFYTCLLYTSPSPRDRTRSRMPSSA